MSLSPHPASCPTSFAPRAIIGNDGTTKRRLANASHSLGMINKRLTQEGTKSSWDVAPDPPPPLTLSLVLFLLLFQNGHWGVPASTPPTPCPLNLKVKAWLYPLGVGGRREVEFLAVVSARSLEVLLKDLHAGGGVRPGCSAVLPSGNKPEHSCLQETSPGPLGILLG